MSQILDNIIRLTQKRDQQAPLVIKNTGDLLAMAEITQAKPVEPDLSPEETIKRELYEDAFEDVTFYFLQAKLHQQKSKSNMKMEVIEENMKVRIDYFESIKNRVRPFLKEKTNSKTSEESDTAAYIISAIESGKKNGKNHE